MNYTIEIEENERTLEFQLDVECNYWDIPAHTSGAPEDCCEGDAGFDIVSVDWDSIEVIDKNGVFLILDFDRLFDWYKPQIQNMLEQDDKLFEAWKKHVEEV